jgi:hypothetical protein
MVGLLLYDALLYALYVLYVQLLYMIFSSCCQWSLDHEPFLLFNVARCSRFAIVCFFAVRIPCIALVLIITAIRVVSGVDVWS